MTSRPAAESSSSFADATFPMVAWGVVVREVSERVGVSEVEPLSVGKLGVTKQLESVAKGAENTFRKLVSPGNLVINSRSDRRGAGGLSELHGSVSVVYIVMQPVEQLLYGPFGHYLFRSVEFQEEFYRYGTGIVDDLWSTRFDRMKQMRIPLPPLETQRAIVDYLDRETAEIDSMLAELDELVALLEERRREVIQDLTGVAGNYEMTKLAVCARVVLGKTLQSRQLSEEEKQVPYVRAGNIQPDGVFDWETKYMWMTPVEQKSLEPQAGDVLVVEGGAGYGRSLFLAETLEGWAFQNHVLRIRPTAEWDGQFIDYVIRAHLAGGLIERMSVGATIPGLSAEKARSLPIPAFPLDEQQRRAKVISTHIGQTREMLSDAAELRSLLLERRSALISDVVTGRKQVV